eukprot:TRINITY_DN66187_c0_g1_i1.p1 TRINITY_DN66187_c0_g1~~TRINITY_DN66187_c0_g1_i1.p1  ORF type:complete len:519 (-),score=102.92 TRINITY_DN66187_c0_g1_i1:44-1507(-)
MAPRRASLAALLCWLHSRAAHGVRPMPRSPGDFFDLLPAEFPGEAPKVPDVDPVASRLLAACESVRGLLTLAIAASELHSMTLLPSGEYDLSLPDFDAGLEPNDRQRLKRACNALAQSYAFVSGVASEVSLRCASAAGPSGCSGRTLGSLMVRTRLGCNDLSPPAVGPVSSAWSSGALDVLQAGDAISSVAHRALLRVHRLLQGWCQGWAAADWESSLKGIVEDTTVTASSVASEARIFLDHTFHAFSLGPLGLPAMDPLSGILGQHAPDLRHEAIAGQRWDVLRHLLKRLARKLPPGDTLRVAEVGVEKGMTISFLMRTVPEIGDYVAVDPWHIDGKPADFNEMLDGYYRNIEHWAANEPDFLRKGRRVVKILRMSSQAAARQLQDNYFDLVFVDAEHTFQEVRRDLATWKRKLKANGGVLAGHDFSLFHPAVALAAIVECGPASDDTSRFPLAADVASVSIPEVHKANLMHLSADSVFWCTRTVA